jgi:hypothetical protein
VDDYTDGLRQAGGSLGDTAPSTVWGVVGTDGENIVQAVANTKAAAWWLALEQAAAVGIVAQPAAAGAALPAGLVTAAGAG